jgi:FKBP-type peptidyl-prolyl cis-trans isomerase FkpA
MRNTFFLMLAIILVFAACSKSEHNTCPYVPSTKVAPAAEIAALKDSLDAHAIPYTQHPSGIFYQIITPGAGATPTVCSNVTVKYKGTLLSGAGFDSSYVRDPGGTSFTLGELIAGWQIGIPLIQQGGSIMLYVPPSLGYGSQAIPDNNGGVLIPANSNLVFKIELVGVQ